MDFRELAKPTEGDKPRKPREYVRSKKRRGDLKQLVNKVVRHERNAAEHRGDKDALSHAVELTRYVAAALAIVQPYEPDGSPRQGGDKEEFWTWLSHMRDLLSLRLPYERPKLASITVREELPADDGVYETILELRRRMIQKGIPVDHLIDRRLVLEHELPEDEGRSS